MYVKKDSKENTAVFWNAQNWWCMPERKETFTALENRGIDCATATGKIPGQKGSKSNPRNACTSCSCTGDRSTWRERDFRNICQLYHTILNNTMWKEYMDCKYKL